MKFKNMTVMIIGLLTMLMLVVGCDQPIPSGTDPTNMGTDSGTQTLSTFEPDAKINTLTFSSKQELTDFLKTYQGSGGYYGGDMVRTLGAPMMQESMAMDVAVADSGSANKVQAPHGLPNDYSETNNQVVGVDEADIIKTDGNYIYTISDNTLYIILAYPGKNAKIVSTIEFENTPSELFVKGDKLAVFGNFYDLDFFNKVDFTPRSGMTFFNVYDITDKENPELEKKYKFEGNYFRGRMIGDYAYIITNTHPSYLSPYPTPLVFDGTTREAIPVSKVHYFDMPYDNPQFVNINSVDITNPDVQNSESVIVEGSQNLYMSKENIYITSTKYINEWELRMDITTKLMIPELTASDQKIIEKIQDADTDILSPAEKKQKIYQIIQMYVSYLNRNQQEEFEAKAEKMLKEKLKEYEYMEFTVIHKISVDKTNIDVENSGMVPGHIVNQFSMDEYDNVFRIATTVSARWNRFVEDRTMEGQPRDEGMVTEKAPSRTESTNHIFTLDKNLKIMDELGDMAEGEQIYSTRFMGDKLYLVTFKQVDPFFVIDLSNPDNIKSLGKLKIPGFSRYLHPYDENTIIGIGHDTTETGRTEGLKISLFDVSDVKNPKEVAKFVTKEKWAQSTAEYEHRAFLFSKEKNLLVIPAYNYDYNGRDGNKGYNGAFVFNIDKHNIELRGIIDHSMGSSNRYYGAMVQRSLFIEDMLYTKSKNLLRINDLEDLKSVKNIELTENNSGPYKVY